MELSQIRGFGPKRLEQLHLAGIDTPADLVYELPRTYMDTTVCRDISEAEPGECCFSGILGKPSIHRAKGRQWVETVLAGNEAKLRLYWFNQPWMLQSLQEGDNIFLYGRIQMGKRGLVSVNPQRVRPGVIEPVYRALPGMGQKVLRDAISTILEQDPPEEILPQEILDNYALPSLQTALKQAHFPDSTDHLQAAKHRLAFDELLLFQTAIASSSHIRGSRQPLLIPKDAADEFYRSLPFAPTGAQRRVIGEILEDMSKDVPMARMVQGDVGCGKTLIAFCAMAACVKAGGQAALMAPTEILAGQHFESAKQMLAPLGISCGLLTGHLSAGERRTALGKIASGEWQVVVGTHALISEDVCYSRLCLAVTDEQHRFGVRQRTALEKKGQNPHVLVMSATPIPRSLSLILYGDLDISIVDELPPGRKPVKTRIVPEQKRREMYGFIQKECLAGHQVYVVCPLVGEGEEDTGERSAKAVYEELSAAFPSLHVGWVHGQMPQQEKETVLAGFRKGEIHVLVATTVIEVGVNNPNATIMVIEGADRFGLAQLHQLRGRVGRGTEESWCFLMAQPNDRLRTLTQTEDGFAIAQKDLELRGAGEYFGTRQSGAPEMPALMLTQDSRLLAQAREAFLALSRQPLYRTWYEGMQLLSKDKYGGSDAVARN